MPPLHRTGCLRSCCCDRQRTIAENAAAVADGISVANGDAGDARRATCGNMEHTVELVRVDDGRAGAGADDGDQRTADWPASSGSGRHFPRRPLPPPGWSAYRCRPAA